ncbi:MAG: hypothetical protein PHV82_18510 [Victivallaceae bacterium]|nr:hypothetical protein [Victivallaceae bacterium]
MIQHGRKVFPLDVVVDKMVRIENDKQKNYPGDNAFILDLKAGTSSGTMEWLRVFPFAELRQAGIEAHIVGVVTSGLDSGATLLPWLYAYLKADMLPLVKFVVVKNEFAGSEFEFFDTKIQEVLTIAKVPCLMLKLNDLGSKYQIPLQRNNSSYGKVATGRNRIEEFGFMDEYRIKCYYAEASMEFKPLFEQEKLKPKTTKDRSDK